jgi:hypothetical protein
MKNSTIPGPKNSFWQDVESYLVNEFNYSRDAAAERCKKFQKDNWNVRDAFTNANPLDIARDLAHDHI